MTAQETEIRFSLHLSSDGAVKDDGSQPLFGPIGVFLQESIMIRRYHPNPTPMPTSFVEAKRKFWDLLDFFSRVHLNPPANGAGNEGDTASRHLAYIAATVYPKGYAWGNKVAWVDDRILPRPYDRRCLHIGIRSNTEAQNDE